jgi:hypothetical protein
MLTESDLQTHARLIASENGARLWRNNSGAVHTADGRFVRFGLANDSTQLNKSFKSSDLIGVRPILITPAHVGIVLGQFVACEIKAQAWRYRGTDREKKQLKFIELVKQLGGYGCFINGLAGIDAVFKKWYHADGGTKNE